MDEHCTFLCGGELTAIVGDDSSRGPGGRQYSGLWSLLHASCPVSPFQSAYAGLIAGAHRGSSPVLERIDDRTARRVRTPCEKSSAATVVGTYRLVEPHYVDYTYEVTFAEGAAPPNPSIHTWCSYMASPKDVSIHFIENGVGTTFTPVLHGEAAMIFPAGLDDAHRCGWERRSGEARFREQGDRFHQSFSGRTFDLPIYFGAIHEMVYLLMADHHRDFRFYVSPSGAGYSAVPGQKSPAWDFAWRIWDARPGETRTLNVRLAFFRPSQFTATAEVWREWETFRNLHPIQ